MLISLDTLANNPFRNMDLYPLDDEQVERLAHSISKNGLVNAVRARRINRAFELVVGHHRVAAMRKLGRKEIEAEVTDDDDDQMVAIMVHENLTQRGNNPAARLDSVAAYALLVTKQVFLGEGVGVGNPTPTTRGGGESPERVQQDVAKGGPGWRMLEREINKSGEIIGVEDIQQAVATLKASGVMAEIVAKAQAEVVPLEEAADQTSNDPPAVQTTKTTSRKKRAAAVAEQAEKPATYDKACVKLFTVNSHENAFRKTVTSARGTKFIPVNQQARLARAIIKRLGDDISAQTVADAVRATINEAQDKQNAADAEAHARDLAERARERVDKRWESLRKGLSKVEGDMDKLFTEQKKWDVPDELFPVDMLVLDLCAKISKYIIRLRNDLGGRDEDGEENQGRVPRHVGRRLPRSLPAR